MGRYEMRLFIETFQNGILQPFYQLLRAKSLEEQEKMKVCLLEGIKRISARIKGPYALGSEFTLADIATVPWPLRFDVIEHFRGFRIAVIERVFSVVPLKAQLI
ncbi:hypothetical protein HDV02_000022 [Globomyces sp. JEL0801]|nr:hypothetical protein HDV02_000022 [Globomyces sp. JEL0801]